jgi:hypothetical protein
MSIPNNASLITSPLFIEFDTSGRPLAGGKLYTYAAGGSIPLATYTDATLTVTNPNPVVLDNLGKAQIWFGSQAYKLNLTDSLGVQQPDYPIDNIILNTQASLSQLLGGTGVGQGQALVGFSSSTSYPAGTLPYALASTAAGQGDALVGVLKPWTGAVATTQHAINYEVNVIKFGAVCDGTTDDSIAVQKAVTYCNSLGSGGALKIPGLCKITSTINIDRAVGQTNTLHIVAEGPGAGFVMTAAGTMFGTTLGAVTASEMISFENLIFKGTVAGTYVMNAAAFWEVTFKDCMWSVCQLCNCTGVSGASGYLQSFQFIGGRIKGAPGPWLTCTDLMDCTFFMLGIEANNTSGAIVTSTGVCTGSRWIDNLQESNLGILNLHIISGLEIRGNYTESNAGPLMTVSGPVYSLDFGGNWFYSTLVGGDVIFNSPVSSMKGGGNVYIAGVGGACRLYTFNSNPNNADISGDWAAAVGAQTTFVLANLTNLVQSTTEWGERVVPNGHPSGATSTGQDVENLIGGGRVFKTDFRSLTGNTTTPFCTITFGIHNVACFVKVVSTGIVANVAEFSVVDEWMVTQINGTGAITITQIHNQGGIAGVITLTQSGQVLTLNYVLAGASGSSSFNTAIEIMAIGNDGGPGVQNPVTVAIL